MPFSCLFFSSETLQCLLSRCWLVSWCFCCASLILPLHSFSFTLWTLDCASFSAFIMLSVAVCILFLARLWCSSLCNCHSIKSLASLSSWLQLGSFSSFLILFSVVTNPHRISASSARLSASSLPFSMLQTPQGSHYCIRLFLCGSFFCCSWFYRRVPFDSSSSAGSPLITASLPTNLNDLKVCRSF